MQDFNNSSAFAMELPWSCTKPLMSFWTTKYRLHNWIRFRFVYSSISSSITYYPGSACQRSSQCTILVAISNDSTYAAPLTQTTCIHNQVYIFAQYRFYKCHHCASWWQIFKCTDHFFEYTMSKFLLSLAPLGYFRNMTSVLILEFLGRQSLITIMYIYWPRADSVHMPMVCYHLHEPAEYHQCPNWHLSELTL